MYTQSKLRLLLVCLLGLITVSGLLTLHITMAHAGLSSSPSHPSSLSQISSWSMIGYNAQHTGYNPNEHTLSRSNVAQLELAWSVPVESGGFSGPVISNGIAYIGSLDKGLYAIDAHTGALIWTFSVTNYLYYNPVVADGIVYFIAEQRAGNALYALNAKTGKVKWLYSAKNMYTNGLIVYLNTVYINTNDGSIDALDTQTGKIRWHSVVKVGGSAVPTLADGLLFVASIDTLYAFDLKTGHVRWQYKAGGCLSPTGFVSTVAYGLVYVSICSQLLAITEKTGKIQWSYTALRNTDFNTASVADGLVVVADNDNSQNDVLFAFDALTGHVKWSYRTGTNVSNAPAIANKVVYFSCFNSCPNASLYALDLDTGHLLWLYAGDGHASLPAIADGFLYARTGSSLLAFHVANTKP